MRKTLTLTKQWGKYGPGTELSVLLPGEDPAPFTIDPLRAATLEADGFTSPVEKPKAGRKGAN
ncbi:MAG TPA: hypothetical protein VD948_10965 [Rhodothermales bacterium]|nr:hypothetical protein [Rhodothermales bacterium]